MKSLFTGFILVFSTILLAQKNVNQIKNDSLDEMRKLVDFVAGYDVVSDIDTSFFYEAEKNVYSAKDKDNVAGYMQNLIPMSYENSKEDLLKKMRLDKKTALEEKEFTHKGKRVYHIKMVDVKDGEKLMSLIFIKEYQDVSIVIFGYYKKKFEDIYLKPIKESALSARLIEKK